MLTRSPPVEVLESTVSARAHEGEDMATSTLSSILLSSTKPERLRDWYAAALSAKVERTPGEPGYDVLDLGGFYLMIDTRDDVGDTNPEPGRMILNVEVSDARAAAGRINDTGAKWLSELEERDGSWFGTAIDPDGNYVQIIELSEEARTLMESS
jgi:predicted enzyme related to lactoylglutathione lyase